MDDMCKFSRQVVHGPHGEDLAPPVESIMVVMHIMRSPVGVKAPEEVALSAAARLQSLRASDGAWRVACLLSAVVFSRDAGAWPMVARVCYSSVYF